MGLFGSFVDFERTPARGDDPVTDNGNMFAGVAPVDLGSFGDVESKLSAASGCSSSTRTLR